MKNFDIHLEQSNCASVG